MIVLKVVGSVLLFLGGGELFADGALRLIKRKGIFFEADPTPPQGLGETLLRGTGALITTTIGIVFLVAGALLFLNAIGVVSMPIPAP